MSQVLTAVFSASFTLVRWTHVALGSETEPALAFWSSLVSCFDQRQGAVGGGAGEGRGQKGQEGVVDAQDKKRKAPGGRLWSEPGEPTAGAPKCFRPPQLPHTPASPATGHWPRPVAFSCSLCGCTGARVLTDTTFGSWLQHIVRHKPGRSAGGRAQAGSWQTAVLSRWPACSTGSDGCYCLCFLLQNRWSRNAERSACRGMKRHQIRYLFVSCVGLQGFEPGGRPSRRALTVSALPCACAAWDSNKSANLHEVMNRHTLHETHADLTYTEKTFLEK